MDEITLRLPSETTTALQSEADQRGVSLESHLRAVVEAYRADDERGPRPAIEYVHAVAEERPTGESNQSASEKIGSFRYGSRSVRPE